MRCPDCCKFVSFTDPIVEISDANISGNTASVNARVVLTCAECGCELKESEIEASVEINHDCDSDFEWENEPTDGEGTVRTQTIDRNGKPITNSRYMKTFYGFTVEGSVKCEKCNEIIAVSLANEEQASGFNEMV